MIWAVLSCPPLPLALCSCFPSCVASLGLWFCRFGVSACAFAGVFPWPSCSLLCVVGSSLSVVFVVCCRHPSRPVVASLPLAVGPLWRPGPVCALVPPSGYLVTAWLPCLNAGGVVVLCRPYFIVSHGSKGLWPCVGCSPSTPCCRCCSGAQFYHAEVFDDPGPPFR